MSQLSRYEFLKVARQRYGGRGRQGRSRLLDEVCEVCGVSRKHAIKLMRGQMGLGAPGSRRGGPRAKYGAEEQRVLKAIWFAAEQPCGKRLAAILPALLPKYEEFIVAEFRAFLAERNPSDNDAVALKGVGSLFGFLKVKPVVEQLARLGLQLSRHASQARTCASRRCWLAGRGRRRARR